MRTIIMRVRVAGPVFGGVLPCGPSMSLHFSDYE
jgi:hypothetical protein